MSPSIRHFALVPAAGVGARMCAPCPKQYMSFAGKLMLVHVLDTFASSPYITHTYVVVSPQDGYIEEALLGARNLADRVTVIYNGGATRQQSVLNGLVAMREHAADED